MKDAWIRSFCIVMGFWLRVGSDGGVLIWVDLGGLLDYL